MRFTPFFLAVFLTLLGLSASVFSATEYPDGTNPYGANRIFHLNSAAGIAMVDALGVENGDLFNTENPGDWVAGQFGNAISLDATDEYGNTNYGNNDLYLGEGFTICMWLKTTATDNQEYFLRADASGSFFLASWDADEIYIQAEDSGAARFSRFITADAYNDNTFHHICARKLNYLGGQGSYEVYFDGANLSTSTTNDNANNVANTSNGDFKINTNNFPSGVYDDILMFKHTLSPSEIFTIYTGNFSSGADAVPVVYILSPTNDTAQSIARVTGNASDDVGISNVFINDSRFTRNSSNSSWQFLNNTLVSEGYFSVNITANDTTNQRTSKYVNFLLDIFKPVPVFTYPSVNFTIVPQHFLFNASCTDANLLYFNGSVQNASGIQFNFNHVASGTYANVTTNITLADGLYTALINCTDGSSMTGANNQSFKSVIFEVHSDLPTVNLNTANNSLFYDNETFTLNYTASDQLLSTCSLFIDSVFEQIDLTPNNFSMDFFSETKAAGNYSWYVQCNDTQHNIGVSQTLLFHVNMTSAPFVPPANVTNPYNNTIIENTKWINTQAFSPYTISGVLLWFMLIFFFFAMVTVTEMSRVGVIGVITGFYGVFIAFMCFALLSVIMGIIFAALGVLYMIRGITLAI